MPALPHSLKVFLCHASADKEIVRDLYQRLVTDGVDAWLDAEKLLPGQNWQEEIPRAVRDSDVVVICLSKSSVTKEGYVQKEIGFALDKAKEMPEGRIFLIPARLERCELPHRLGDFQCVDLFDQQGYQRLMVSLQTRAEQITASRHSEGREARREAAARVELLPGTLLTLGGTNHVVHDSIARHIAGKMNIQAARASDQVMQEDVGILHISFAPNYPNLHAEKSRLLHRAHNMNEAAFHCPYLPVIKRISPRDEKDVWLISQWIKPMSLSKYYPANDPLPGTESLNRLLGYAIDICDALAALHKRREVHGGVSENAIVTKQGIGAVLIDPAFAGNPLAWKLTSRPFDPRVDIKALGDVLYRIITHQAAGSGPVRQFNSSMPAELETLIAKAQNGTTGHVLELKHALIQIRKKVRS